MATSRDRSSNQSLVQSLQGHRYIRSSRVAEAMTFVDRGNFCPFNPYRDAPQSIGYGVTISAPHMHAIALELLEDCLCEGCTALDVGSGSGYLTACMGYLVGETGHVVGIEHIDDLARQSQLNLRKNRTLASYLTSERVKIVVGDGRQGFSSAAPYDAIHVGAAAVNIPQALTDQLKPGGRLIIPVGPQNHTQKLLQVDKALDGTVTQHRHMSVSFVPLTSKKNQCWS